MKPSFTTPDLKFPESPVTNKAGRAKSAIRIDNNVAEMNNGIVLNLCFDGIFLADLLKYLRENSLTEYISSIEPANKNSVKKLHIDRSVRTMGIWIDDKTYLTWREFGIMERLSKGWLNKEIANDLKLGYNTVRNNLQRIYRKFNVGNRSEAIIHYLRIRNNLEKDPNCQ